MKVRRVELDVSSEGGHKMIREVLRRLVRPLCVLVSAIRMLYSKSEPCLLIKLVVNACDEVIEECENRYTFILQVDGFTARGSLISLDNGTIH